MLDLPAGAVEVASFAPVEAPVSEPPPSDEAPAGAAPSFDPASTARGTSPTERASFFAQPLPLKTMAGVVRALRIAPPQTSHASGPVPWIEWTTSTERPQDVQRYT